MDDYRILCVEREEGKIVAVGTDGDDGVANRRWTVAEARTAIAEGACFYVVGGEDGGAIPIEVSATVLWTPPELGRDGDLDGLRECQWR